MFFMLEIAYLSRFYTLLGIVSLILTDILFEARFRMHILFTLKHIISYTVLQFYLLSELLY